MRQVLKTQVWLYLRKITKARVLNMSTITQLSTPHWVLEFRKHRQVNSTFGSPVKIGKGKCETARTN